MSKMKLFFLYVIFIGILFAQYIENKDFATRVYFVLVQRKYDTLALLNKVDF